jgi:hypothetical protein
MGRWTVSTSPADDQAIAAIAEMTDTSKENVIEGLIALMTRAYQEEMGETE